jgi:hypothetical protein
VLPWATAVGVVPVFSVAVPKTKFWAWAM